MSVLGDVGAAVAWASQWETLQKAEPIQKGHGIDDVIHNVWW